MSGDATDVVIIGSGPVGTAVARELADRAPSLRLLVLDAGPVLGPVAGGHVKNITDAEQRTAALVQLPTGAEPPPGGTPARPGTALIGAPAMPNAAISTNVGGMGAHWTAACPRPTDDEVPGFLDPAVLDDALSRAEELLAVTTHAFDGAPLRDTVQQVLAGEFDRPHRRPVGPMPVAVTTAGDGSLHWTGPAVIAGDPLSGVSWVPYAADRPFHGQVMQMDASPVPLDPGVTVRPGQVVGLGWFCRKEVSAEDRVWFDEEAADEHDMPAIRIDYTLSAADRSAIAAAVEELRAAAHALGRPLGEPFVLPAGSSLHYQGTTRMGPADDGTSVCDPTGRVWGTANLYVGGNNVIPTATACNPTLTAVAFGVLSARALTTALAGAQPIAQEATR